MSFSTTTPAPSSASASQAASGAAETPALTSRLPEVGTTIFSVMSALAAKHAAVNLGQGFPDFDCDPGLVDAVTVISVSGA